MLVPSQSVTPAASHCRNLHTLQSFDHPWDGLVAVRGTRVARGLTRVAQEDGNVLGQVTHKRGSTRAWLGCISSCSCFRCGMPKRWLAEHVCDCSLECGEVRGGVVRTTGCRERGAACERLVLAEPGCAGAHRRGRGGGCVCVCRCESLAELWLMKAMEVPLSR